MTNRRAKVTVQDIARKAEVSTATVSRAFNDSSRVNPETYQKILNVANELGYTYRKPQSVIRNQRLTGRQKQLILISMPSMLNPFYAEVIEGIQTSMQNSDYEYLLYTKELKEKNIDNLLNLIDTLQITGWIALTIIPGSVLQKLTERIPVVQCCEHFETPYASSVGINDFTATLNAMEYLLSMGKKKISIINGPLDYKYARDRLAAYKSIMESSGIEIQPQWIIQLPDLNQDMAFSSVVNLLNTPNAPECFFAVSDVLAAAAIRAIQYCNLKVPEDVLVIGFDNTNISQLTTPSITTINQPRFQLGFMAGELLTEKINNPLSEVRHIKLNTELIIRESTTTVG